MPNPDLSADQSERATVVALFSTLGETERAVAALVDGGYERERISLVASNVMLRHGSIDTEERMARWREAGWTRFDERAEPFTREQVEEERARYGTGAERRHTGGAALMAGAPRRGCGTPDVPECGGRVCYARWSRP